MATQAQISFTPPRADLPAGLLAYTTNQVCAALQIRKVTLWRLEKRGLLHPLQHLRHKRYAIAAVARFASGCASA